MLSLGTLYICPKCGETHIRKAGAIYTANVPTHCGLIMRASDLPGYQVALRGDGTPFILEVTGEERDQEPRVSRVFSHRERAELALFGYHLLNDQAISEETISREDRLKLIRLLVGE